MFYDEQQGSQYNVEVHMPEVIETGEEGCHQL